MSTRIPPLLSENKDVKQFPLLNSGEKSVSVIFSNLHPLLHSLHSLFHSFYTLKNYTLLVEILVGKRVEECSFKEITFLEIHYNFKEITLLEKQYNFREILQS